MLGPGIFVPLVNDIEQPDIVVTQKIPVAFVVLLQVTSFLHKFAI